MLSSAAQSSEPSRRVRPRTHEGPASERGLRSEAVSGRDGLGDHGEELLVRLEGGAQRLLHRRVDLADAALGDAEDLADLGERHVLDVEQDGDLALAAREAGEGGAEQVLGLALRGGVERVLAGIVAGDGVDALDRGLIVGQHRGVQRCDVRAGDLVAAAAQLVDRDAEGVGQLVAGRAAAMEDRERLDDLLDVALPAAHGARRPVLTAQLVEHGAVNAGPRVLLERCALLRVVALDRVDERLQATGDEVLGLAASWHLAQLLVDDVLDQGGEGQDKAVTQRTIVRAAILAPEGEGVLRGHPACRATGRGGERHARSPSRVRDRTGRRIGSLWRSLERLDGRPGVHPHFCGGGALLRNLRAAPMNGHMALRLIDAPEPPARPRTRPSPPPVWSPPPPPASPPATGPGSARCAPRPGRSRSRTAVTRRAARCSSSPSAKARAPRSCWSPPRLRWTCSRPTRASRSCSTTPASSSTSSERSRPRRRSSPPRSAWTPSCPTSSATSRSARAAGARACACWRRPPDPCASCSPASTASPRPPARSRA